MAEVLAPSFLFSPTLPVRKLTAWPKSATAANWDSLTPLPPIGSLDQNKPPVDARIGWHEGGLVVGVEVRGKHEKPFAEPLHSDRDDRVVIGIDTRDTKTIHRAGKFCHRFHLTPADENGEWEPALTATLIPRATQDAPIASFGDDAMTGTLYEDGYRVVGLLRADALNGYDPAFSDRLGVFVEIADREYGPTPLFGDAKLPGGADPSLWPSLRMIAADA